MRSFKFAEKQRKYLRKNFGEKTTKEEFFYRSERQGSLLNKKAVVSYLCFPINVQRYSSEKFIKRFITGQSRIKCRVKTLLYL